LRGYILLKRTIFLIDSLTRFRRCFVYSRHRWDVTEMLFEGLILQNEIFFFNFIYILYIYAKILTARRHYLNIPSIQWNYQNTLLISCPLLNAIFSSIQQLQYSQYLVDYLWRGCLTLTLDCKFTVNCVSFVSGYNLPNFFILSGSF
jgi:hypothetical protein